MKNPQAVLKNSLDQVNTDIGFAIDDAAAGKLGNVETWIDQIRDSLADAERAMDELRGATGT